MILQVASLCLFPADLHPDKTLCQSVSAEIRYSIEAEMKTGLCTHVGEPLELSSVSCGQLWLLISHCFFLSISLRLRLINVCSIFSKQTKPDFFFFPAHPLVVLLFSVRVHRWRMCAYSKLASASEYEMQNGYMHLSMGENTCQSLSGNCLLCEFRKWKHIFTHKLIWMLSTVAVFKTASYTSSTDLTKK